MRNCFQLQNKLNGDMERNYLRIDETKMTLKKQGQTYTYINKEINKYTYIYTYIRLLKA